MITVTDSSKKFLPFDLTPLYIQRSYEAELSIVPDALASFEAFEKGEGETTKSSICEYVNDAAHRPDFLVTGFVGRKGPKLNPTILGSSADYSLRSAHCTSIIIKPRYLDVESQCDRQKFSFICAVDGSVAAKSAFEDVMKIFDPELDEVVVVHIHNDVDESETEKTESLKAEYEEALSAAKAVNGSVKLIEKEQDKTIAQMLVHEVDTLEAQFLAVGADGMRAYVEGAESFLGSVSDYCVRHARSSIIVAQNNTVQSTLK